MVLINVDFPRPVCPAKLSDMVAVHSQIGRTNTDDVELEAALEQLSLDLAGN